MIIKIDAFKGRTNHAPIERYGLQLGIGSKIQLEDFYPYLIWVAFTWGGVKRYVYIYLKKPSFRLKLLK
jgi:hypothetical protein